jgi:opacity protein-like surface antigen
MKKFGMMLMSAAIMLSSAAAMASQMRIDFNNGEYRLPECGGTIEAKGGILQAFVNGSQANQVNLIVRDSQYCSNFILDTSGREYKLQRERDGGRGGSFTITAEKLHSGWNHIDLTVRSDTGIHKDSVGIWVNVVGSDDGGDSFGCSDEAEAAARDKYFDDYGRRAKSADATFLRTSHSGNLVFDVSVRGRAGSARYEAVMRPDCSLAARPRALD